MVKKRWKKLTENVKGVVAVSRQALKHELKGSGKFLGAKVRIKRIKYKKRKLKDIKKGLFTLGLNTKKLYS